MSSEVPTAGVKSADSLSSRIAWRRSGECALCRQALRVDEQEIVRVREAGAVELRRKRFGRHGSKLFQVVEKLQEIEREELFRAFQKLF